MRTILIIFISVVLSVIVTALVLKQESEGAKAPPQSAYDRVMESGTIRCGYGISPPWILRDPNTKEMSGLNVDTMKAIARRLNLKLEWGEETGWGTLAPALATGKVDVACSGLWIQGPQARELAFTRPYSYNSLYAYARADETRFNGNLAAINDPSIRFVTVDGEVTEQIHDLYFPKSQKASIPSGGANEHSYIQVTTGKADVVTLDDVSVAEFNRKNPDTPLKRLSDTPLITYGTGLAVDNDEMKLRDLLDAAITELANTGELEQIMRPYQERYPGAIRAPALPYKGD